MNLVPQLHQVSLGSEQAFRQIVQQFGDRLFQFAFQMVKNREDAQEIISDVFLKVWQLRRQLPPAEKFVFYLYKATKNTGLNYLKKSRRKKNVETELYHISPVHHADKTPEDYIISEENLKHIRLAINTLPPRCRQIFLLIKEDQLSYKQTAELLDISEATVNVQITIALKKINDALKPRLPEIYS